jgi:hypothetical protein
VPDAVIVPGTTVSLERGRESAAFHFPATACRPRSRPTALNSTDL